MPLYNRVISLKTGKIGNENVLNVSGNKIVFKINKTHTSKDNVADVEIYNLNETSRTLFSTIDNFVIIEAGYVDFEGLKTIFVGNITEYETITLGADRVTKIVLQDGSKAVNNKNFSKSYKAGTLPKDILEDILNDVGLPKKLSKKAVELLGKKNKQYNNGMIFSGETKKILNDITKLVGLTWSVQNNVIKVTSVNASDDSEVIVLNKSTGLIGSPLKVNKIKSDKNKKGYELISLLRGELEPAKPIVVESQYIDRASFLIEEVQHTGDSYGKDWTSKLIVSEV